MAKILLVDDRLEIVVLTARLLEKEGYEVTIAQNGLKCLELLKTEKPDLVLLDIMMPDMDGWEVCNKIKGNEKTKDVLVAMFTVKTEKEDLEKRSESECDAYITKPFKKEELLNHIRELLKQ
jgi:two-component system alkaline phosphatase synthesis response regulator PhoP